MKTITTHFPQVKKRTKFFLTKELCERYLVDDFELGDFSGRFGTELVFAAPCEDFQKPRRKNFRKFLLKLARNDNEFFMNLFTDAATNKEGAESVGKCRHNFSFRGYSDCGACMFCDFETVKGAFHERTL